MEHLAWYQLATAQQNRIMLEWYDLNARHAAIFIWGSAVLAIPTIRSPDVRKSIFDLLRLMLSPSISLLVIGLLVNVACLTFLGVLLGRKIGFWETLPVVSVSVWSLTSGITLLLHLSEFLKGENEFRSRVVAVLGPSTVITGIVNIAILAFWLEMILAPVIFFLAVAFYSTRNKEMTAISRVLLPTYALGLMLVAAIALIDDPRTWKSLAQAVLLPIALTVGTLPYMQLLVIAERIRFIREAKYKVVSSTDYGADWPLTVSSAKLCSRFLGVWVEVGGRKYRLNGTSEAILRRFGHKSFELDKIWKDHPEKEKWANELGNSAEPFEWKVNIGRLIQDGLALEHQS